MSEWNNVPTDISDYTGFVYIITNKLTGKYYIGQKILWETEKRKPTKYLRKDGKYVKDKKRKRILNPRKNRIHIKRESDWKSYWGSCDELKEDIEKLGIDNFVREILILCKNKNQMNYYETKIQFDKRVLFDDNCYNGIINCRITRRGLK